MEKLYLIELESMPIFEMLALEEALLRTSEDNFCLINSGSSPAIVMGISGKPEELIHLDRTQKDGIPLIRRFSGGGTVYIDEETLFVTFICQSRALNIAPYPKAILNWSESFYRSLFSSQSDFELRENDFVFGERKIGGNAEYLRRERALLHTSFLWDYDVEKMEYLRMPKKRPEYRKTRPHGDFLGRLKERFDSKRSLRSMLTTTLSKSFNTCNLSLDDACEALDRPHRKQTSWITFEN